MKRAPMRKIREALRLRASGMSTREMASSLSVGRTTLREYLSRANRAGLDWPLPVDLSDSDLEARLFPQRKGDDLGAISQPDWAYLHRELRRKGVTLELLSNLVFEVCGSCGDLVWVCGFNSVFECDACDDFGEVVKSA